jgi:hypothetical protein
MSGKASERLLYTSARLSEPSTVHWSGRMFERVQVTAQELEIPPHKSATSWVSSTDSKCGELKAMAWDCQRRRLVTESVETWVSESDYLQCT